MLLACALATLINLRSAARPLPKHTQQPPWSLPCLILGGGRQGTTVRVADLDCEVVAPEPFSMQQWALVSRAQQDMLRKLQPGDPMPCGFADLSNNNSVNIFWNHMRLWERATQARSVVLILEDDCVALEHSHQSIKEAVTHVLARSPPGFVLKLHNNEQGVKPVMRWGWRGEAAEAAESPECLCDHAYPYTGTMAYALDPEAARRLLRGAAVINTHVDIHMHERACMHQAFALYSTRNLFTPSARPSLHRSVSAAFWWSLDSFSWQACNTASRYRRWTKMTALIQQRNHSHCPSSSLL